MDNPLPTIGLVLAYLTWVLVVGPLWMRDRKPFNINSILVVYNAFQVTLSAYMFYEVSFFLSFFSFYFSFIWCLSVIRCAQGRTKLLILAFLSEL